MREKLEEMKGERRTFAGVFKKTGTKTYKNHVQKTILLKDIELKKTGEQVADHLWFNYTKKFKNLKELEKGDKIQFDARVKPYTKGYINRKKEIYNKKIDYKLNYPTKVEKLKNQSVERKKTDKVS